MAEKQKTDPNEQMKQMRQQALDKLRAAYSEKKQEVKEIHTVKITGPRLAAEAERQERAMEAARRGGLNVIVKKKDD